MVLIETVFVGRKTFIQFLKKYFQLKGITSLKFPSKRPKLLFFNLASSYHINLFLFSKYLLIYYIIVIYYYSVT